MMGREAASKAATAVVVQKGLELADVKMMAMTVGASVLPIYSLSGSNLSRVII
jgi:hypothetical protein